MEGPLYLTEESKKKKNGIVPKKSYPGCQRLSCAVSGFGQVLKSLRPKAEDVSACGRRSSSSQAKKKISGAQGK